MQPSGSAVIAEGDPDQEEDQGVAPLAIRSAPPWLVSMVIHMVVLIVLGLLYLPQVFTPVVELEVVYAEELGEQLLDDTLQMETFDELELTEPVLALDMNQVDDPLAAPPELDISFDAVTDTSTLEAPSVGIALTGREAGMKKALLAAYGGTAKTEDAVLRGLEWLKRNQQSDGFWSLTGPYSNGSQIENKTAATAMALLAFQGAGHTHRKGDFRDVVDKGWKALLSLQNKDGDFFREGPQHHRLYSQAQATIAVCELYAMTQDSAFRQPAQRALNYAARSQAPIGGWRYTPGQDADTSVTGWFVIALQSGKMAGLEVQSPTLAKITEFLDRVSPDDGYHYGYKPGDAPTVTMTAEALLCRQYLGWKRDDPRLASGATYLVNEHPIDRDDPNVYYWYYATQMLHHMQGDAWNQWNRVMRDVLPDTQVQQGKERGSWDPGRDQWGGHGGRLFTTCLSIYCLEVYYRHLPIYSYRLE